MDDVRTRTVVCCYRGIVGKDNSVTCASSWNCVLEQTDLLFTLRTGNFRRVPKTAKNDC
jgi:hypothetical protein